MLHVQEYHRSIFHTPNSSIEQQGYKTKLAFGDIAQFLHEEALIRKVENFWSRTGTSVFLEI